MRESRRSLSTLLVSTTSRLAKRRYLWMMSVGIGGMFPLKSSYRTTKQRLWNSLGRMICWRRRALR
jgi:hypothetical protein